MQQDPLLQTKLYIPPIRPELVSRRRLIERLNAGLNCKLTLVSAPAGFGKTTLLSEWATAAGEPIAWLSLGWSEWLEGLTITHTAEGETMLTGSVLDQSALYGLLARLRDLGLPLLSVNPSEANTEVTESVTR